MAVDFENIYKTLKQGIAGLAESSLKEFATEATVDGHLLLDEMKEDIEKWSNDLANGDISSGDFKDLLLGQKDLIKMTALKHKGLALVRADKFKNAVFTLIADTISATI